MGNLYMFAIMPPEEVANVIHNERVIFAAHYNCVKALKPPVHITIYPPFEEKETIEREIQPISEWVALQQTFGLELSNYSFFRNRFSPVVYIDVVENATLQAFRKEFVTRLRKYISVAPDHGPYKPHFTIGYRDVPLNRINEIEMEYAARQFKASFRVSSIFFWKYTNKKWETIHEFKLAEVML